MPRRARQPCNARPDCPELVPFGACLKHQGDRRPYDQRRGTAAARGYGHRWNGRRADYLKDHPRCERCGRAAQVPHHVVPRPDLVSAGVEDPDADEWLEALCRRCHARAHASRGEGKVPSPRAR